MAGTFAQKGGAIRWARLPQFALPALSLCAVRLVVNVVTGRFTDAATTMLTRQGHSKQNCCRHLWRAGRKTVFD